MRPSRRLPNQSALVCVCIALGALAGCGDGGVVVPDPGPGARATLTVAGKAIDCAVAADPLALGNAAMFLDELPDGKGIFYVYPREGKQGPSMRSVKIPLTVAFVDETGKILQIEDMKPHDSRATQSKMSIRFAVQVNRGWYERNGIDVGASFDGFKEATSKFGRR